MASALQTSLFPGVVFNESHLSSTEATLAQVLDRTAALFDRLDLSGIAALVAQLAHARAAHGAIAWQNTISKVVAPHRVRTMLHQDPLTGRAFAKPRGYAGDAALLDLIYRDTPYAGEMTMFGALVHQWTPSQSSCQSVCERRELLAALIDRIADERPLPRILSLACGHLREAQHSSAVRTNAIGEIVAVDQDPLSLEVIARELRNARITPVKASIRRFLVDPTIYGDFDLVYSAGLYDYLDDEAATRLTSSMFSALRPGGTLVVANFAPELPDIGYMEAIMDWKLIYRNEHAVACFCDKIPAHQIREQRMQRDSSGSVVYLTVQKC
ncbi:MAG TPA: class I SAM-dependent methyltransferase [Gemmatimonadaceae bacterium]|jgi:SAM-dependent methyltransferase